MLNLLKSSFASHLIPWCFPFFHIFPPPCFALIAKRTSASFPRFYLSIFEHVSCISRVEPRGLDRDHLPVSDPMAVQWSNGCLGADPRGLSPWPHGCLSSRLRHLGILLENTCGRD